MVKKDKVNSKKAEKGIPTKVELEKALKEAQKESKEVKKLNKELSEALDIDGRELSNQDSPEPHKPKLNHATRLLYAAMDWCIVLDQQGKAYGVWKDSNIDTNFGLQIKEL